MADELMEFERARDGEHWRLRTQGSDVEGHAIRVRLGFTAEPVEGEGDVEGHGFRVKGLDAEGNEEDAEGHGFRARFFDAEGNEEDAEGHGFRFPRFKAKPVGEEDGQPLYKLEFDEEGTEGHMARFSDRRLKRDVRGL